MTALHVFIWQRSPSCARTASRLPSTTSLASKTVDGVADVGFALSAWFVDPGGNTIGLLQFKDKGLG
jgi:hypothetical protein